MRFVLDEDVDANVVGVLKNAHHQAWTIPGAGLASGGDDEVTVYAAKKNAVVMTHDKEFSARRRKNPHGRHVQLGCDDPDAVDVVRQYLEDLVAAITPFDDVFVYLSQHGLEVYLRYQ